MKNRSIDRAIKLLKTNDKHEDYFILKLSPNSGCCCSHCLPETWNIINDYISPVGPIKHEGDELIQNDFGEQFVLEQHESGPEIIIYLATITASATLLKSIIDLIITIIKAFSSENKKHIPHLKLSKKKIIKN